MKLRGECAFSSDFSFPRTGNYTKEVAFKMEKRRTMSRMRKPDLLLQNLMDFYKEREHLDRLLRCIDDNHPEHVSIRNIEFGITKFSKRRNAVHEITTPEGGLRYFNIYLQYKSQLKA